MESDLAGNRLFGRRPRSDAAVMFGRSNDDQGGIAGLGSLSSATSGATSTPSARPTLGSPGPAPSGPRHSPLRALRIAFGWALMLGGLAVSGWAIYELMSFGTCASGGPYVSARECAPDTGLKMTGIFAGTFAVLIGTALVGSWRAAAAAWGLTFTGGAALFFLGAYGPDGESIRIPFTFCGLLFLAMGLPGLWEAVRPKSRRERRQTVVRGPYGIQLAVDAVEDGGPAPVVMAGQPPAGQPGSQSFPFGPPR